jgi:uridine kinase
VSQAAASAGRRARVLDALAEHLIARPARSVHPLRVAVDGVTGAGKSTFAGELVDRVARGGAPALHLSTDDFHHRREHRRRDPDAARGYYRDAYDLDAFRRLVLDPLGLGGRYVPRLHDLATDAILCEAPAQAPAGAVVVVDGTFLQGAALRGAWDVVVWLDTTIAEAERRAVGRDATLLGGEDAARAAYRTRYHAACRLYLAEVGPDETADVVVRNDDLAAPVLTIR